jgi:hypothetical protein
MAVKASGTEERRSEGSERPERPYTGWKEGPKGGGLNHRQGRKDLTADGLSGKFRAKIAGAFRRPTEKREGHAPRTKDEG